LYSGRFPSFGSASKRISNYKKGLEQNGHEVIVYSIHPGQGYALKRILLNLIAPFSIYKRLTSRINGIDILFIYGFGWLTKLKIIRTANKRGIKTVFEVNEYPYSIVGSRRDKYLKFFNPINRLCLNRFVFPLADGFVVISEPLFQYISKFKSPTAKIIKIPIIVDYSYYQLNVPQPDCIKPYILHSSTMNDNKDGISAVFNAIAEVNSKLCAKIHFYLTSKLTLTETWSNIRQIIQEKKLNDYVHFLGDLDEQTLLAYQHHCAMVVLNKVDSLQNRYNFATKLGEYLALGKPIITTLIGEVSNYLIDNENCIGIPPNRPDMINKAILNLLNDPILAKRIGENGRELAKQSFDFRFNGTKLSEFFVQLVSKDN
jgi:glycosyltransferase involved in cell wall biosynthesis